MPTNRKIKQFAVYTRMSYLESSGGESNFIYYAGYVHSGVLIDGVDKQMSGMGDDHWKVELETDSIDEAIGKVRELMDLGHSLPMIRVDRTIEIDKKFKLLT